MAVGERGAGVQAYLDKHKITKLFEDLLSNVVKELPASPVDFLISKLQVIKQKKKLFCCDVHSFPLPLPLALNQPPDARNAPHPHFPDASDVSVTVGGTLPRDAIIPIPFERDINTTHHCKPSAVSGTSGRSKLQVSGSAISTRAKPSTSTTSKSSGLRPPGGKISLPSPSSSSSSSLSKPTSSRSPRPSPSSSSIPKPGSKTAPRASGSQLKPPLTTPTRPATAPSSKSIPKPTAASSLRTKTQGVTPSQLKSPRSRTGASKTSSSTTPRSKPASGTTPVRPRGKVPSSAPKVERKPVPEVATEPVEPAPKLVSVAEKALDDNFGAAKEPSPAQYDEDDEGLAGSVKERQWSEEEEEEEEEESVGGSSEDIHIDDIIQLRKSTHSKHTYIESLLAPPTGTEATPLSEGYGSEEEESEEEVGVEIMEDYTALEEEGVTNLKRSKYAIREAPPLEDLATVDLRLKICARCARVMSERGGEGEASATDTVSMVTADFESASQVGSHASFPQWTGSAGSSAQLPHSDASEVSSDVTLQSHDTWGDLAPQPRTQLPHSDVESEIQLPPPAPLEGQPWSTEATPTQQDHYGWAQ